MIFYNKIKLFLQCIVKKMQQSVFDLILWQPFSMLCTNMTYFNSLISKSQIQKIKYHKSTHIRTLYHLKFWLESRQNSDLIKKKTPTYFMKTSESSICLYIHAYLAKRDIVKHKKNIHKYQIFQHTEMWARKDF